MSSLPKGPGAAFDETLALDDQTFADLVSPIFIEPDDRELYEEYVRGFDDVPTLSDAVALPPRRALPPDFRRGERKDARKRPREDSRAAAEARARELEYLYGEYVHGVLAVAAKPATNKKAAAKTPGRRKPRRKKSR
jgi:hypothetical protein